MKRTIFLALIAAVLAAFPGCKSKKYENPVANDSSQPDKLLFDRAVHDLEHSRFEVARLTLQTMLNTYPDSEYLAKAKLAVADSWYRQGGTSGLAQAEAEYKDFITFFPSMEEAVEAQYKVAMIHYNQMDKSDRDTTHSKRAEDEFKNLLTEYPDSKFSAEATQRLREVQENLADGEFKVGQTYFVKGATRSAVLRLKPLAENYPFYSQADSALFMLGQAWEKGGKDFREMAAQAYAKILRDYPLSDHAGDARAKLAAWKMPIPEADPAAIERMKYDQEHHEYPSRYQRYTGALKRKPDVSAATHSGDPTKVHLPAPPPPQEAPVAAGDTSNAIKLEPATGAVPEGAKEVTPGKPATDTTAAPKKPDDPPADAKPDSKKDKKKKKKDADKEKPPEKPAQNP